MAFKMTKNGMRHEDSIKENYEPLDDTSQTGFTRPPRVAGCVLDYFRVIGMIDSPQYATDEMKMMLDNPEGFFRSP